MYVTEILIIIYSRAGYPSGKLCTQRISYTYARVIITRILFNFTGINAYVYNIIPYRCIIML